jgi:hypothetical protein
MFNANETRLLWKKITDQLYKAKEKNIPGFKASKDLLTLLLGGKVPDGCKLTETHLFVVPDILNMSRILPKLHSLLCRSPTLRPGRLKPFSKTGFLSLCN